MKPGWQAARLREARLARGLSQEALAERCGGRPKGWKQSHLSAYETGRQPGVSRIVALARALDVTTDWLLGLSTDGP